MKYLLCLILLTTNIWAQSAHELKSEINSRFKTEESLLNKKINEDAEVDSEKIPQDFKALHFKLYQTQAHDITRSNEEPDENTLNDFDRSEKILEKLEFEEGKVDKVSAEVEAHLKKLEGLKYKRSLYAFIDFVSWQQDVNLSIPAGDRHLIVTNQGYCAGGGYGKQNARYHYFVDGCFLYGRGDIAAQNTNITYHQNDVYALGLKASLGGGLFVSSAKAELGFKIPLLYSNQHFDNPNQASFPGYQIDQPSRFSSFASLYTRWPLDNWFFQTEFGKMLSKDLTIWSLGIGYKF